MSKFWKAFNVTLGIGMIVCSIATWVLKLETSPLEAGFMQFCWGIMFISTVMQADNEEEKDEEKENE